MTWKLEEMRQKEIEFESMPTKEKKEELKADIKNARKAVGGIYLSRHNGEGRLALAPVRSKNNGICNNILAYCYR